jgi:cation diffusion facilitator family transporter
MAGNEKQSAAFWSMWVSAALALAKLVAGLVTGSLGILSEALHNIADFGATAVTYLAVKIGDRPPDEGHHYGHAKAESLAALVSTCLLFGFTAWVVYEALLRLFGAPSHVEITWWALGIIAVSICVDFNRSRALRRVASTTGSAALAADAVHFSSDMWSSLAVLAGLAAVWMGFPMGDALAGLLVSGLIAWSGWTLGRSAIDTLLDAAPAEETATLRDTVENFPGVIRATELRVRPGGSHLIANLAVDVPRTLPVEEAASLKQRLADRIVEAIPKADVTIAVNPAALDTETVFQRVMMIASRRQAAIHHLAVQDIQGRLAVSFDVEVDGATPLAAAHDAATLLETDIRRQLGTNIEVESHIEPLQESLLEGEEVTSNPLANKLLALAKAEKGLSDVHNVRVRRNAQGLFVHYHCRFDGGTSVVAVHKSLDRIEDALVVAHAEPVGVGKHEL